MRQKMELCQETERRKKVYYETQKERVVLWDRERKSCTMRQRRKELKYETERREVVDCGTERKEEGDVQYRMGQ